MIMEWHKHGEKPIHPGAGHASQRALDAKQWRNQQAHGVEGANEVGARDGNQQEGEWMRQLEHVEEGVQRNQIVGVSVQGFSVDFFNILMFLIFLILY